MSGIGGKNDFPDNPKPETLPRIVGAQLRAPTGPATDIICQAARVSTV